MAFEYLTEGVNSLSAGNWSGSGIAAAGQFSIPKTSQAIINDLDFSGTSAVTDFDIGRMVTAPIGTVATPLEIGVTGQFQNDAGQGTLYVEFAASDSAVCGLFNQTGTGKTVISGGTVEELNVGKGEVDIGGSVDVQDHIQAGGTSYFAAGSPTHDTIVLLGGTLRTERSTAASGTIDIMGGSFIGTKTDASLGNGTRVNVWGGDFEWRGTFGTGVVINAYGGAPNLANITRTATLPTVNVFPTVKAAQLSSRLGQLTVTTTNLRIGALTQAGSGPGAGGGSGG